MSVKSLVVASAVAVGTLGIAGCVDVAGPYGPYYDGYYDVGPMYFGGDYYGGDGYFERGYHDHHRIWYRDGGFHGPGRRR